MTKCYQKQGLTYIESDNKQAIYRLDKYHFDYEDYNHLLDMCDLANKLQTNLLLTLNPWDIDIRI